MNHRFFEPIQLDEQNQIFLSRDLDTFKIQFRDLQELWNLHPPAFHTLKIHGKEVKTPRWQQAYGKNYHFSGSMSQALPITNQLAPFQYWCQQHINADLNGLLLNWYNGEQNHYIGAHRDDTRDLQSGSPIVTISLGEERVFRLRPWKGKGYKDLTVRHGEVLVIPWQTNLTWTHEVPALKKYKGKRISITLRAFL